MASQDNSFNAGQAQMRRDNQEGSQNFLSETGTQVKNMAHGATEVGKGAALGAASLARGAAQGAANVAQGAADALKNTFGMSGPGNANKSSANVDHSNYPNNPSYAHTPNNSNM